MHIAVIPLPGSVSETLQAVQSAQAEFVFLLPAGAQLAPDAAKLLEQAAAVAPPQVAALEGRAFPFEHPKLYDPVTLTSTWALCGCTAYRRTAFIEMHGFDETAPAAARSEELSLRLLAGGYTLQYVPAAHILWDWRSADAQAELACRVAASLYLRCKFGTQQDVDEWARLFDEMTGNVSLSPDTQTLLLRALARVKRQKGALRAYYRKNVAPTGFAHRFWGFDTAFLRAGKDYACALPRCTPQFTVVVRTYRRPAVLLRTLECLRHQTYPHFHVIVAEDGCEPVSEQAAQSAAAWLSLTYLAARDNVGRCATGNLGVQAAQTQYVCFLDDDDYWYAEHLEQMAALIEQNPDARLFFAGSVEGACDAAPSPVFTKYWNNMHPSLSRMDFWHGNAASIQSAVFCREDYLAVGGLDPVLDALEDWDLWLRLLNRVPMAALAKATSLYRVPCGEAAHLRTAAFTTYHAAVREHMTRGRYGAPPPPPETAQAPDAHLQALRASAAQLQQTTAWRLCKLFGAKDFDAATATQSECNRFIFRTRASLCWRVLARLRGRGV